MKKINFFEANKRFVEQGRTDINLCEDNYETWKKNARFWDCIVKDWFWAIPKNVYIQKSSHPKRAIENRKQTNVKKYGNSCSLHGKTQDAKIVQEKTKKSLKEKYGKNIRNVFQAKIIKDKSKETLKKKYGIENISQLKKQLVIETGECVENWFNNQKQPKPVSYQSFGTMFLYGKKQKEFSIKELEKYIEIFRCSKTKLEMFTEQLLNTSHFNKKLNNITISCRPDFKLTDGIYLNVDGLYWHGDHQKDKHYHFNLRKDFEKHSLRLFQFREDEVYHNTNIVKSIINNSLNKTVNKAYARKCIIKSVSQQQASEFYNTNHLMGSVCAKHLGLYNFSNSVLIAVISYKIHKNICNVERFCSLINHSVVGGFSKLLSYLEKKILNKNTTEIHNWVDLRYGTGIHLLSKGFKQTKETLGWKWTDGKNTFNRLKCKANMDERKLTEKQHAEELGWYRIYDAGQRLFIKQTT